MGVKEFLCSKSHSSFKFPICPGREQCWKVRSDTKRGAEPGSLDQHSAKTPAWSPSSGKISGEVLCLINAGQALAKLCNKSYLRADHGLLICQSLSVWSHWVLSPELGMAHEFSRHSRETWSKHSGIGDELTVMAQCLPLQRYSSLVSCLDFFLKNELISGQGSKQKSRVVRLCPTGTRFTQILQENRVPLNHKE